MTRQGRPLAVRLYAASLRFLVRVFAGTRAVFTGFWLGVLSRENLFALDALFYDGGFGGKAGPIDFLSPEYNRRGLWHWERAAIERFFPRASAALDDGGAGMPEPVKSAGESGARDPKILLIAAGAGREVLALRRLGFEIDAYECHAVLAAAGTRLLENEGVAGAISSIDRGAWPQGGMEYDGAIVGWGGYMLTPSASARVAFLRGVRSRLVADAPVLLSFYARTEHTRADRVTRAVANLFRFLLARPACDLGDALSPNYVHYFTRDQIEHELRAGGFEPVFYSTEGYGHALGLAGRV